MPVVQRSEPAEDSVLPLARWLHAHASAHKHARTHRAWVITGDIAMGLVGDLSLDGECRDLWTRG